LPAAAGLTWLLAGLIVLSVALAYANAWHTPFVFDDSVSIQDNLAIRQLWPPTHALLFPQKETVAGRPLLNLSFALNYAAGGLRVEGYHAVNLAIHAAAALLLFGLVRRSLARFGDAAASWAGFGVALLWALHPLQTESVTYIVQRAESLMGLLFLATLYAFVRSVDGESRRPAAWRAAAVAACALGMAAKEVMAAAPIVVLLYDRAVVAGNFRSAWKARRTFYAALASTWLILLVCLVVEGNRHGSAGLDTGVSCWRYAAVELCALPGYLRRIVWPSPLCFYDGPLSGPNLAPRLGPAVLGAVLLLLIVAGTVISLWRNRPAGFLGAAALMILAPTSSLLPVVSEPVAEHRLYLPLAAALCLLIPLWRRWGAAWILMACLAAIGLGAGTHARNRLYASPIALWQDTFRQAPENYVAANNLGLALIDAGREDEAGEPIERARKLSPTYDQAWYNLGLLAARRGDRATAMADYREAIRLTPNHAKAHNNLGVLLGGQPGGLAAALAEFEQAGEADPEYPEAQSNWGKALAALPGRESEAIAHFREAVRLRPDSADARYDLASVLAPNPATRQEAIAQLRAVVRLQPDNAAAHVNLGAALFQDGDVAQAIAETESALRLDPSLEQARSNLETFRRSAAR
jgi:tetratricopeptide (TPR) repeat protein